MQVSRAYDACCNRTWQPQHKLPTAHVHLQPQCHAKLPQQLSLGVWHSVSNQWTPRKKALGGRASPSPPLWSATLLLLGAPPWAQPPLQGRPAPVP